MIQLDLIANNTGACRDAVSKYLDATYKCVEGKGKSNRVHYSCKILEYREYMVTKLRQLRLSIRSMRRLLKMKRPNLFYMINHKKSTLFLRIISKARLMRKLPDSI